MRLRLKRKLQRNRTSFTNDQIDSLEKGEFIHHFYFIFYLHGFTHVNNDQKLDEAYTIECNGRFVTLGRWIGDISISVRYSGECCCPQCNYLSRLLRRIHGRYLASDRNVIFLLLVFVIKHTTYCPINQKSPLPTRGPRSLHKPILSLIYCLSRYQ